MNSFDVHAENNHDCNLKKRTGPIFAEHCTRGECHKKYQVCDVLFGQALIKKQDGIVLAISGTLNHIVDDSANNGGGYRRQQHGNPQNAMVVTHKYFWTLLVS